MKTSIGLILAFLGGYSPLLSQDNPAVNYIQHVSVDYSEPNIVYAASRGQGLFKSVDHGESWTLKCDSAGSKYFNVVVVDPRNPERVFAGGQESGVLLSTDKGETWTSIGLAGVTVNDIAVDKSNPDRLFVLAGEGVYSNQDIEKEAWVLCFDHSRYARNPVDTLRDEGSGRSGRHRRFGYGRFQKIAISPFHPNTIITGARWESGFFRSDDGGATWKHETISGIFRRVDVIHFHPSDPNIFYIATHHQGIFKTYNFGKSWTPLSDGLEPQVRSPYYGAYLISGFAADRTDPDVFYSGSDYSNWKTVDGGEHWFELDKSLSCEFVRGMAVDPVHPNIVYAGSNVGMYKSTDGGKSWRAINSGFQEVAVDKVIEVQTDENKVLQFALSPRYPFVFKKSEGEKWISASWLLAEYGAKTGEDLYFDAAEKALVLVADNGKFISKDFGFRWIGETPPPAYAYAKSAVKELTLDYPDFEKNHVLTVHLDGDVFFDDSLVDSLYRRPPYISLQVVEVGYPYNGTVPAWSMNLDDIVVLFSYYNPRN